MFWKALILGFFCAIAFCLGVIFLKWIMLNVGINFFALLLFLMTTIFMLVIGDQKYDEDNE